MKKSSKDAGAIAMLVERFEKQRLPRALALKDKVDRGEVLDNSDIEFLERVFEDSQHIRPLVAKHPEWNSLVASATSLYKEITDKALSNEQTAGERKT